MKPLLKDNHGNIGAVSAAVAILVSIFIAVLIVYSIAGGIDVGDADADIAENLQDVIDRHSGAGGTYYNTTFAGNATRDTLDQSSTFFTIAPLIVVVLVAVIILGYVVNLGGGRRM